MSDGRVCCILGLCCASGSSQQYAALTKALITSRRNISEERAAEVAERILLKYENFEMAHKMLDEEEGK